MANITEYLNIIKNSIFGKDVRSSIHDGIEAINNESNNTRVRQDLLENKYDEQIKELANQDPQLPEIVDARQGFDTLGEIIKQKIYHFNTVADMKECENLDEGNVVQTLGYYEANDNGSSLYKIVLDLPENQYYEILNNGLYAVLIHNKTVNIKQIGAYGDNSHDDTSIFNRFVYFKNIILNSNETYIIKDVINLNSLNIIGNNATIKIQSIHNREHLIRNNNWLTGINNPFSFNFKDINFYWDSNLIQENDCHLFGFTNCNKIILTNCSFTNNEELNSGVWFMDCYSCNENVTIDNCYIKIITQNDADNRNTPISFRENNPAGYSRNLQIKNCYIEKNSIDETLWIDSWYGLIENIYINNNYIEDISDNSQTFIFVASSGDNANEFIKNVYIENNTLIKKQLNSHAIVLGDVNNSNTPFSENINFDNNFVKVSNCSTNNSYLIQGSLNKIKTNRTKISNCKISINSDNENTFSIFALYGNMESLSNDYSITGNINTTSMCLFNCYSSIQDNFDIVNAICDGLLHLFMNGAVTSCSHFLYAYNKNISEITVKNSIIKCTQNYFSERISCTSNMKLIIENCDITHGTLVDHNYNNTGTSEVILNNNNFNSNNFSFTNNGNATLIINNNTLNGKVITGYPNDSTSRQACVVGTIFSSSNNNHAIIKKVSAGDSTSNWLDI